MKVSGLDVHKDSIFCAIYDGKVYSEVKEYATMTESIGKMGEYLQSEGVVRIAMERTVSWQGNDEFQFFFTGYLIEIIFAFKQA